MPNSINAACFLVTHCTAGLLKHFPPLMAMFYCTTLLKHHAVLYVMLVLHIEEFYYINGKHIIPALYTKT